MTGGGLYIEGRGGEISDCIICENYAGHHGGGMCGLLCDVKVTRCLIAFNVSPVAAGVSSVASELELVDSVVAYNTATEDTESAYGAGVYMSLPSYGQAKVTNCLFLSNASLSGPGGAAYIFLNDHNKARAVSFSCCTFSGNTAPEGGAALCAKMEEGYSLPGVEMTDCIFQDGDDEIWEEEPGLVVVENSCIEGGWDGEGNFDADPLFVSGPLGDYYLARWEITTSARRRQDRRRKARA